MTEKSKFPQKVVVDASAALAFLLPDERKTQIDQLFKASTNQEVHLYAPEIFYFEVFNGLKSAVLKKRITEKTAKKLVKKFLKLKVEIQKVDFQKTFQTALNKKLSFYDASYFTLAKQKNIPLYSLDKLLKKN